MKPYKVEWIQGDAVGGGVTANGDGLTFDVLGYPATSFQVFGTFAGGTDVAIEFLSGLATWEALPVKNVSTGALISTGIVSAAGTYLASTVGLQKVRARVLNYAGADEILVVATGFAQGAGEAVAGAVAANVTIVASPTGASATQVQGPAADNAAAVGNPVYVAGKAVNSATYAPGYTAGDAAGFAFDINTGALLVDPGLPPGTTVSTVALAASLVIKNAAGILISIVGYNSLGADQYIQVHNAAALPANGAVPTYTYKVAANSNFSLDIPLSGAPFTTGIVVCNSSTLATKTLGAADCWFTAVRI